MLHERPNRQCSSRSRDNKAGDLDEDEAGDLAYGLTEDDGHDEDGKQCTLGDHPSDAEFHI